MLRKIFRLRKFSILGLSFILILAFICWGPTSSMIQGLRSKLERYELHYYYHSASALRRLKENTECTLPVLDPFDKKMMTYFNQRSTRKNCYELVSYFRSDVLSDDQPVIISSSNFPKDKLLCCYEFITFLRRKPFNLGTSQNCIPIKHEVTNITDGFEFVIVRCFDILVKNRIRPGAEISKFLHYKQSSHEEILIFVRKPRLAQDLKSDSGLLSSTPKEDQLNVIIFGLDGVPRMNFIRLMRRTYEYLVHDLKAIDLHGYTKVGDATLSNLFALLMGLNFSQVREAYWPVNNSTFDTCPWIWKAYEQLGYTTLFAEDYNSVFQYRFGGFLKQPTKYYLHPFSKWLGALTIKNRFGNIDCIGNISTLQMIVNYAKKASWSLKDSSAFQVYWAGLVNYLPTDPRMVDEAFTDLLHFWNNSGIMNKSIIILLSDHGWRFGRIMNIEQTRIENKMPFAFFLLPKWFQKKYPGAYSNLIKNQWKLTTPFDVHATLLEVLNPTENLHERSSHDNYDVGAEPVSNSISLFHPIPSNRNCHSAGIDETWCVCGVYKPIDDSSEFSLKLAMFAVQEINKWLKPFKICFQYSLARILAAEERNGPISEYLINKTIYRLQIELVPKAARFEVILFVNEENEITMSKEVFRLNAFIHPCIMDHNLVKLCTCDFSTLA